MATRLERLRSTTLQMLADAGLEVSLEILWGDPELYNWELLQIVADAAHDHRDYDLLNELLGEDQLEIYHGVVVEDQPSIELSSIIRTPPDEDEDPDGEVPPDEWEEEPGWHDGDVFELELDGYDIEVGDTVVGKAVDYLQGEGAAIGFLEWYDGISFARSYEWAEPQVESYETGAMEYRGWRLHHLSPQQLVAINKQVAPRSTW